MYDVCTKEGNDIPLMAFLGDRRERRCGSAFARRDPSMPVVDRARKKAIRTCRVRFPDHAMLNCQATSR